MPYNKLNISGAKADVLSWVTHGMSERREGHASQRFASAVPLQTRGSDAGRTSGERFDGRFGHRNKGCRYPGDGRCGYRLRNDGGEDAFQERNSRP